MPPAPPPPGGGSKPKSKSKPKPSSKPRKSTGGGSSAGSSGGSTAKNKDPWVIIKNGKITYSSSVEPPSGALRVFGLPARKSDFLQARSHYNDLFRAWLGRPAKPNEVASILRRGVSDYALRLQLVRKPAFTRSVMYRNIRAQAADTLGFDFKIDRKVILQAMKSEGGISESSLRSALANNRRAQEALRKSFMQTSGGDVQYLSGAFGQGNLNIAQQKSLAMQQSGLRQTTLGARLQGQLDQAVKRMERAFQGTLAQPNLSLGPAGLQATSLQPQQEPDLPA